MAYLDDETLDHMKEMLLSLFSVAHLDYYGYLTRKGPGLTKWGGFENEVFAVNPYYWGNDDDHIDDPNFYYKPSDYELYWYKYPPAGCMCKQESDVGGI